MPLHEYRCLSCNEVFEVLSKFSDAPLKVHEKCGGGVQRLMSAPGFHLKGSGWYATDYAKAGAKPDAKPAAEGEGKKADASPAASSSESSASTSSPSSESKESKEPKKKESKPESKPAAPAAKSE